MNQVGEQAFASFFHSMYTQQAIIHPIVDPQDDDELQRQNGVVHEDQEIVDVETGDTITTTTRDDDDHHVLSIDRDDAAKLETTSSFVLSFSSLTYSVQFPQKLTFASLLGRAAEPPRRNILSGISGEARDGEILALLGASGSGKSTLLDALAGRIEEKSLSGEVTLNGEALSRRVSKAITAYVMQDDLLFPMLTVEETLGFAAEFRLPRKLGGTAKKARVDALIDQLGLRGAATTIIGDEERRGVSGGERRRVSIGIDIIHDPILLFLDEPTSGLDSTSAFAVVKVLKGIARSGSVVVMSIHQPSYRIVGLLDRLIFLSRGEQAYRGSVENLPLFFSGFGRPIPENTSHLEFALDLISELENSDPFDEATNPLVEFNRTWQESQQNSTTIKVLPIKEALKSSRKLMISNDVSNVKTFANPFWKEIIVLFKRSTVNSRRTSEIFATRLMTILTTGFLLATVYWQLDDTRKGMRERVGFLAFAIATTYFSSCQYLPVFIQERHIFMRETAYNAYRRSSYALAHALSVLPPLLILSLAFSTVTFIPVGLAGGPTGFLSYSATIAAAFWAGNSFAVFVSGLVPDVLLGYTVVVSVSAYFLLLSGFFIARDRVPPYWLWLHYGSLVKYPFEAVMRGEFGGGPGTARCFVRGAEMFDDTPFGGADEEVKARMLEKLSRGFGVNVTSSTCLTTGLDVLKAQGVSGGLGKWMCLLVVVGFGFFYRFLFYVSLLLGSKNRRK